MKEVISSKTSISGLFGSTALYAFIGIVSRALRFSRIMLQFVTLPFLFKELETWN